jgi:lipid-A-disaccharide synthase
MDREVVRELIQHELNEKNLKNELHRLLKDEAVRKQMASDYRELALKLGESGASGKAAYIISDFLNN